MIHKYRQLVSTLCYFLIGIIWYFIDEDAKKDPVIQYHAKQGLIFLIATILFSIALHIVQVLLAMTVGLIPIIGAIIITIVSLLGFVPLILAIIGVVNAIQEKEQPLPIIGKYGKELKI